MERHATELASELSWMKTHISLDCIHWTKISNNTSKNQSHSLEPTDLYLVKIEEMDWRKFHELNGFGLWHRHLMHCTNQNVWKTIPFVEGLEKLVNHQFDEHEKCPECMIGKSTRQDNPGDARRATRPLGKVNFDLISSSITSIEGYNYAALFVDDHTGFRWVYRLKKKDEIITVAQRWK